MKSGSFFDAIDYFCNNENHALGVYTNQLADLPFLVILPGQFHTTFLLSFFLYAICIL